MVFIFTAFVLLHLLNRMSWHSAPELSQIIPLLFGCSSLHLCVPDCYILPQLIYLDPSLCFIFARVKVEPWLVVWSNRTLSVMLCLEAFLTHFYIVTSLNVFFLVLWALYNDQSFKEKCFSPIPKPKVVSFVVSFLVHPGENLSPVILRSENSGSNLTYIFPFRFLSAFVYLLWPYVGKSWKLLAVISILFSVTIIQITELFQDN